MLCWEWTTSQVSGLGKSPNKLLTEITDTALTVTQPQNQRQTTMDNSNRSLTDPLCHSLQTHPGDFYRGPRKGFRGFGKNYGRRHPFHTASLCLCSWHVGQSWVRGGMGWVSDCRCGYSLALVLKFGSAINLVLNLEQVFWGFIFSPIKWLTEIFWDLNGQAYESL